MLVHNPSKIQSKPSLSPGLSYHKMSTFQSQNSYSNSLQNSHSGHDPLAFAPAQPIKPPPKTIPKRDPNLMFEPKSVSRQSADFIFSTKPVAKLSDQLNAFQVAAEQKEQEQYMNH